MLLMLSRRMLSSYFQGSTRKRLGIYMLQSQAEPRSELLAIELWEFELEDAL